MASRITGRCNILLGCSLDTGRDRLKYLGRSSHLGVNICRKIENMFSHAGLHRFVAVSNFQRTRSVRGRVHPWDVRLAGYSALRGYCHFEYRYGERRNVNDNDNVVQKQQEVDR